MMFSKLHIKLKVIPLPGWLFFASSLVFLTNWIVAFHDGFFDDLYQTIAPPLPRPSERPLLSLKVDSPLPTPSKADSPKTPFILSQPSKVVLTFDDGPHHIYSRRLLNILQKYEVQATFFVNGCWLAPEYEHVTQNREILKLAVQQGHTIGNHTFNHSNLHLLTEKQQAQEILANEKLITELIGVRPTIFRSPYATLSKFARSMLKEHEYRIARWNVSVADEKYKTPVEIRDSVLHWIKHHEGGIVMLHDRFRWTVEAMPLIFKALQEENCHRLFRKQSLLQIVPIETFLLPVNNSPALVAQDQRDQQELAQQLQSICFENVATAKSKTAPQNSLSGPLANAIP